MFIGYLFVTGKLELRADVLDRAVDMSIWIESIILISVVAAIIVVFTNSYNKNLSSLILKLETQNEALIQHQAALVESKVPGVGRTGSRTAKTQIPSVIIDEYWVWICSVCLHKV